MKLRGKEALEAALKGRRRLNKYHVSPPADRTVDGILFASKAEAAQYKNLCAAKAVGAISFFLRQVPFHLPGGVKYVADFLVFYDDGSWEVQDVKGMRTASYRAKKKIVEALYPVKIQELR